jgi:hypothetical protein
MGRWRTLQARIVGCAWSQVNTVSSRNRCLGISIELSFAKHEDVRSGDDLIVCCDISTCQLGSLFPLSSEICTRTVVNPNAIYAPILPSQTPLSSPISSHLFLSHRHSIPTRALILIILYLTPINQQKSHIHTPINLPPGKLTSPTSAADLLSPPKSFKPCLLVGRGSFQLFVLYHHLRNRAPAEEPERVVARL